MKTELHPANTRGTADHGWLKTAYSFSFSSYHNPARIHFGALRVLNDDYVAGGMGFGKHPHDNMEIVTIPLKGALAHEDSAGNKGVIQAGDVQIMSAGSGIYHSEFNASPSESVELFQIWVMPKLKNITPRYDQRTFQPKDFKGQWKTVVSPLGSNIDSLQVNQDTYFNLTELDLNETLYNKTWKILFSATSPAAYSLFPSANSFQTITIAMHLAKPIKIKPTMYSG